MSRWLFTFLGCFPTHILKDSISEALKQVLYNPEVFLFYRCHLGTQSWCRGQLSGSRKGSELLLFW